MAREEDPDPVPAIRGRSPLRHRAGDAWLRVGARRRARSDPSRSPRSRSTTSSTARASWSTAPPGGRAHDLHDAIDTLFPGVRCSARAALPSVRPASRRRPGRRPGGSKRRRSAARCRTFDDEARPALQLTDHHPTDIPGRDAGTNGLPGTTPGRPPSFVGFEVPFDSGRLAQVGECDEQVAFGERSSRSDELSEHQLPLVAPIGCARQLHGRGNPLLCGWPVAGNEPDEDQDGIATEVHHASPTAAVRREPKRPDR